MFSLPLSPADLVEAGVKKAAEKFRVSHPHLEEIPGLLQKAGAKLRPVISVINKQDVKALLSTVLGHRLSPSQIDLAVQAGELLMQVAHILAVEFKLYPVDGAAVEAVPAPKKAAAPKAPKAAKPEEAPKDEAAKQE